MSVYRRVYLGHASKKIIIAIYNRLFHNQAYVYYFWFVFGPAFSLKVVKNRKCIITEYKRGPFAEQNNKIVEIG